jgi:hypothetical protein
VLTRLFIRFDLLDAMRCAEMRCGQLAAVGCGVGCHGVTRWLFVCPAGRCTCTTTHSPAASHRRWAAWQLWSECGAAAACVTGRVFLWAVCGVRGAVCLAVCGVRAAVCVQ